MVAPKKTAAQLAEEKRLRDYYAKNGHVPTLLSNVSRSRFGSADSKLVGDLGRQVALGKLTRAQAEARVRQGGGTSNADDIRAGLDVSAQIDPQQASIQRRRDAAKRSYEAGRETDTTTTKANAQQVAAIYQQLMQQHQAQQPQIQQLFNQEEQQQGQLATSLQDQIRNAYQQANAATQTQVAGMGGGQTEAQTQGAQDQAFLTGLAGLAGASRQNITAANRQGALGIHQAAGYGHQAESGSRQADMFSQLAQRLAEMQRGYSETDTELSGQHEDLENTRYSKLYETKKSLEEARLQAQQEAEDRQFERWLAESKLGIDQGELDIKRGNLALDQQKVQIMSRETDAKLAAEQRKYTPGSLEYEEIQAAIDLKRAQAGAAVSNARSRQQEVANSAANRNIVNDQGQQKIDAAANQPPKAGSYGRGIGGAQTYVNAATTDKRWRQEARRLMEFLPRHKDYTAASTAMEKSIKNNGYPPHIADMLRRMTGIYYGVSS